MSMLFVVTDAKCCLAVHQGSFPCVSIAINGVAAKLGKCPDAVKMAAFEKSVEKFVAEELPKFVKFAEVES